MSTPRSAQEYAFMARELQWRAEAGLAAMCRSARGTAHEALVRATAMRASSAARNYWARTVTGKVTAPRDLYSLRCNEARVATETINRAIRDRREEAGDDAGADALRRAFYARSKAMGSDLSLEDIDTMTAQWREEVAEFRARHVCGVECGALGCDEPEEAAK